ncbi:MAG TPA: hypothetical protein VKZ63_07890 [Kofleriaceae bacterium]|nr:hypothetical protein [Kofleriaceae bacterium]
MKIAPILSLALLAAACGSSSTAPATPAGGAPGAEPAAAASPAAAVTAEEVLDRYVEVTGGADAHHAITAVRVTGTFSIPKAGLTGKAVIIQAAPRETIMRIEFPGMGSHEAGVTGDLAWEKSAMTGARIIEGEERDRALLDATLNADIDWRKHYRAELAGSEEQDGRTLHKVVLTPLAGGAPRTRFFDAETGLLVRSEEVQKTQMGEVQTTSVYSDYREVGAAPAVIKVSHRQEVTAMGNQQVITTDSVEINPTLPADTFAVPAEIEKLKAAK